MRLFQQPPHSTLDVVSRRPRCCQCLRCLLIRKPHVHDLGHGPIAGARGARARWGGRLLLLLPRLGLRRRGRRRTRGWWPGRKLRDRLCQVAENVKVAAIVGPRPRRRKRRLAVANGGKVLDVEGVEGVGGTRRRRRRRRRSGRGCRIAEQVSVPCSRASSRRG